MEQCFLLVEIEVVDICKLFTSPNISKDVGPIKKSSTKRHILNNKYKTKT